MQKNFENNEFLNFRSTIVGCILLYSSSYSKNLATLQPAKAELKPILVTRPLELITMDLVKMQLPDCKKPNEWYLFGCMKLEETHIR